LVKVTLELPDDLIREMARIQKLYGMSRDGLVLSAVRRRVDECEVLASQAIKGKF